MSNTNDANRIEQLSAAILETAVVTPPPSDRPHFEELEIQEDVMVNALADKGVTRDQLKAVTTGITELTRAAHHAEREQREQRRRAVEHVQQRPRPRGARPAAQHPERVEQQSERRTERKRRQKLQHLLRDRQLHQPNSRAQKPSPRCCSSS